LWADGRKEFCDGLVEGFVGPCFGGANLLFKHCLCTPCVLLHAAAPTARASPAHSPRSSPASAPYPPSHRPRYASDLLSVPDQGLYVGFRTVSVLTSYFSVFKRALGELHPIRLRKSENFSEMEKVAMKSKTWALWMCAVLVLAPYLSSAQNMKGNQPKDTQDRNNPNTWSQPDSMRIVKEVRSKLASLNNYGVFDSLHFGIEGRKVILEGYASRPTLKSEAENVVKKIQGVEAVENHIKVLPLSSMDDGIRMAVYRRIYSQPSLRRYTSSPVGFGRFPSVALAAGGITQDPPIGYHAIHIIVDTGHVILKGVVDSQSDADIAAMQANQTFGVFSVENDLQVAGRNAKS
jgi:hyperosmotically inducible protein